jgi:hypothetical protein
MLIQILQSKGQLLMNGKKWISAMQGEKQSLEKNGTWDVVRLPKHKKVVRCKWIFKRKEGLSPKEHARFKARLVAKGFS